MLTFKLCTFLFVYSNGKVHATLRVYLTMQAGSNVTWELAALEQEVSDGTLSNMLVENASYNANYISKHLELLKFSETFSSFRDSLTRRYFLHTELTPTLPTALPTVDVYQGELDIMKSPSSSSSFLFFLFFFFLFLYHSCILNVSIFS